MRRGIPVTTPARTLHDLRPFLLEVEFTNVLREAEFRRLQIGTQMSRMGHVQSSSAECSLSAGVTAFPSRM